MARMREHTIGDLARLAGVSVRTLHHYDEIGLLVPSGRSDAGYRLYSGENLARLRQILFYRELDFSLEAIAAALKDPQDGAHEHLRRQHGLLRTRRQRIDALLEAIEHEMEARAMGISLTPEEQLEVFGTDQTEQWSDEARERWGHTEARRESQRRTAAYTKEDWIEIKREGDANTESFAQALRDGELADSARAMDAAEAHRRHISRWFYKCTREMHTGLAALFISDERFALSYERHAPGLARYVHDAIRANAAR
jgi:MerR family transcriptional regulator, thiopeptide resistance regulator